MQQTTKYNLNIIEPLIDNIDPEAINGNMEIIDAALAPAYTESSTLTNLTSGEKISVAFGKIKKAIADFITHKNAASPHSGAYSSGNPPHVSGTYVGDGNASKFINLGFTPSAVYVGYHNVLGLAYIEDANGKHFWGGFAVGEYAAQSASIDLVKIVEGGFNVYKDNVLENYNSNVLNQTFKYIAFK